MGSDGSQGIGVTMAAQLGAVGAAPVAGATLSAAKACHTPRGEAAELLGGGGGGEEGQPALSLGPGPVSASPRRSRAWG